jgi:transcription initiation factor TFIID subunit TAF12
VERALQVMKSKITDFRKFLILIAAMIVCGRAQAFNYMAAGFMAKGYAQAQQQQQQYQLEQQQLQLQQAQQELQMQKQQYLGSTQSVDTGAQDQAKTQTPPLAPSSSASSSRASALESHKITLNCTLSNQYVGGQVALILDYKNQTVNDLTAKFSENYIKFQVVTADNVIINYSINRLSGYLSSAWNYDGRPFSASGMCSEAKRKF